MSDCERLIQQWKSSLDAAVISEPDETLPITEVPVRAVARPGGLESLCVAVRLAAEAQCPIYPMGGRTQLDFGMPGQSEGVGIDTRSLNHVLDYPSRDMTITVQGGLRMAELREILGREGQRLPVDVPRCGEATIGGTIATNSSGPRRFGHGTLRDYVLGTTVVNASGNETKAGGRVVKNVAGYDLCKLYTGSFGTLGIITQVTLKLKPAPESSAMAWMTFPDAAQLASVLERLTTTRIRPSYIDVLNRSAAETIATGPLQALPLGTWIMVVGIEENADAVAWQVNQLQSELRDLAVSLAWIQSDHGIALDLRLTEFRLRDADHVVFKANIRRSGVADFLVLAQAQPLEWRLRAHAGNGIVYGHADKESDLATLVACLRQLRERAVVLRGNLVLCRCPTDWKLQINVWGEPRGDSWLMQAIKRRLDPHNLFNPGRFIPA